MPRVTVFPSQEDIADPHTLIAQKYAGYLIGHNYRAKQQRDSTPDNLDIDPKPWKEPKVFADDCEFCQQGLSDEQVIQRVLGYQAQIDIEVVRSKDRFYRAWLNDEANAPYWVDTEEAFVYVKDPETNRLVETTQTRTVGSWKSHPNRRRFVELTQDVPRENRPYGWETKPFPMVDLPLRLKRKLCIEWNHLYRDYLARTGYHYDFRLKEFWKEVEPPPPCEDCGGIGVVTTLGSTSWLHTPGCPYVVQATIRPTAEQVMRSWYAGASDLERSIFESYFGGPPDSPVTGEGDRVI